MIKRREKKERMHVHEEQQVLDVLATREQVKNLHDGRDDRDEHQHHQRQVVDERTAE